MVTPFAPVGNLDEPAVRRVLDHLIQAGVDGIFLLGTTGEEASMSLPMRERFVAIVTEHVGKRVTTYAGISHNSLSSSVEAANTYTRLGVDTLVARLPTYYALTDEEQYAYFQTLLVGISGPLMLYNISNTTHMAISVDVVKALSQHPQVVGIKDSDNDPPRLEELVRKLGDRVDFAILTGVTRLSAKALSLGADGCVPSLGNLAPNLCQSLYESARRGDMVSAEACQHQLNDLDALLRSGRTLAQSIGLLKAAMGALALCGPAVLPPLIAPSPSHQEAVRAAFERWQAEQDLH
jgi:4-hydroxy-tetrahydrodipicolinate synthase